MRNIPELEPEKSEGLFSLANRWRRMGSMFPDSTPTKALEVALYNACATDLERWCAIELPKIHAVLERTMREEFTIGYDGQD